MKGAGKEGGENEGQPGGKDEWGDGKGFARKSLGTKGAKDAWYDGKGFGKKGVMKGFGNDYGKGYGGDFGKGYSDCDKGLGWDSYNHKGGKGKGWSAYGVWEDSWMENGGGSCNEFLGLVLRPAQEVEVVHIWCGHGLSGP